MCMKKVRINITVDKELLNKAKTKLNLFGGKISTLFNSYLYNFVESIDKKPGEDYEKIEVRTKELETKIRELEKKVQKIRKGL